MLQARDAAKALTAKTKARRLQYQQMKLSAQAKAKGLTSSGATAADGVISNGSSESPPSALEAVASDNGKKQTPPPSNQTEAAPTPPTTEDETPPTPGNVRLQDGDVIIHRFVCSPVHLRGIRCPTFLNDTGCTGTSHPSPLSRSRS
jgi:hypothetical protein